MDDARVAIFEGDRLVGEADFEGAIGEYKTALDLLPKSPMTLQLREAAQKRWADASVEYSRISADGGDYEMSRRLLQDVIDYDSEHANAKRLLKRVNDPGWYNPAIDPKLLGKITEVERLLQLGVGQFDTGQFDAAKESYNSVLRLDKYNTAARKGLESVDREIINSFYADGRRHMRAKMLGAVDAAWASNVPPASLGGLVSTVRGSLEGGGIGDSNLSEKLKEIIVPTVSFSEVTVQEAVEFLKIKSIELDVKEPNPDKKGVNMVVQGSAPDKTITLDLNNIPLGQVLDYICKMTDLQPKVEAYAVKLVPLNESLNTLYNRVFRVPPDFISGASGGGAPVVDDPFAPVDAAGGSALVTRQTAKEKLEALGVTFEGADATAYFDPGNSRLIVRNTITQLDLIEAIVGDTFNQAPKQIYITTKFVEITQTNTEELGFDWTLGAFNIGGDELFGSGGVVGNSTAGAGAASETRFPIVAPGGGTVGTNPLSRGLRFGSTGIVRDSIDGLLDIQNLASPLSPGILGIAGVFSDPQFQVLVRALDQKKGVDLMSAPSVVTRSGQRAKIEVIREFIYPVEFEPPEIPEVFGGDFTEGDIDPNANQQSFGSGAGGFPVTPTTPTAFETRNIGVTMEVDPVLGDDGYTIDLSLAPEVVEFEGFINYGSPITSGGITPQGQPTNITLTENKIEQPIFATRKATTALTIWDGQTVGIGGLMREDVQSINDSTPILGDLPLIGRLWRLESEEHFKRNLMIFVTARIIDPSGVPVHSYEDLKGGSTATGDGGLNR